MMRFYSITDDISKFVSDGLKFDLLHICIQIIATLILFLVVKKYLYKPIHNLLEGRRNLATKTLDDANQKNEAAEKREKEAFEILEKAKAESREIVKNASLKGQKEHDRLIQEAKEEAQHRMDQLETELNQTIKNSRNEIKNTIVDIAFQTAEKILGHEVSKKDNLEFVNRFIEEVGK